MAQEIAPLEKPKKPRWGLRLWDVLVTAGIGALILGVVVAFNWRGEGEGGWRVVPYVGGVPTGPPPEIGKPAPDFTIPLVDVTTKQTAPFRLSDYRGRVVWLNFWASWCPPCRAEMPDIQQVWQEVKDQGVVLVAIAFGELPEDSIDYMERNRFTIPVGLDLNSTVSTEYRLAGLPTHFFIDRQGILRELRIGVLSAQGMRSRLEKTGSY